ncbi:hypothetical protein FRC02_003470 [Tulasnella sp. 418]|nr:hypothetical protein FRC02_003470 [Tulasnella sp. 418]
MGKDGEVNVEQFVLEHYEIKGYKGFHAEGRIVTHLFCLLFWSILFDDTIEGAFETCYQSAPLDLSHDTFYPARREAIDKRLQEIETDVDRMLDIIREVDDRERPRKTWAQGARWDMFELQDTLEIAEGLGGKTLGVICKLLCEEYGKRASGVPDLIVWNAAIKDAHFVEVKGPGDSLQENQKLWIDVLVGCGATVEVCRVENLDYQSPPRKQRKAGGEKAKSKASKRKAHSVEMESEDEHVAPQISDMELKMDEEKVPVSPVGRPQKRDTEGWNDVPDISPATKRQKLVSAS